MMQKDNRSGTWLFSGDARFLAMLPPNGEAAEIYLQTKTPHDQKPWTLKIGMDNWVQHIGGLLPSINRPGPTPKVPVTFGQRQDVKLPELDSAFHIPRITMSPSQKEDPAPPITISPPEREEPNPEIVVNPVTEQYLLPHRCTPYLSADITDCRSIAKILYGAWMGMWQMHQEGVVHGSISFRNICVLGGNKGSFVLQPNTPKIYLVRQGKHRDQCLMVLLIISAFAKGIGAKHLHDFALTYKTEDKTEGGLCKKIRLFGPDLVTQEFLEEQKRLTIQHNQALYKAYVASLSDTAIGSLRSILRIVELLGNDEVWEYNTLHETVTCMLPTIAGS